MRWIDIFRTSLKMLKTNLLRTTLTILGIATAIALIVVLIGMGYGVQTLTIGSIIEDRSLLSLDVMAGADKESVPINQASLDTIKGLPGVTSVSPVVMTEGQIEFKGKLVSNTARIGNESLLVMDSIQLAQGRSFTDGAKEVVVSPQTLELLGVKPEDILNQPVTFKFVNTSSNRELITLSEPVTVVGITSPEETPAIFVSYDLVKETPGLELTSIKVLTKERDAIVAAQTALVAKGYTVESLVDTLDAARNVFKWVTIGLSIIAAIALVVAAIGMFNTLTITLLERTREIGIMKAIGLTNRDILKLFLADAIVIGFLGGLCGVIFGLVLNTILENFVNRLAAHYGGIHVELFQYPPGFLISMVAYPLILGILTGLYPSIRAAKLNPLKALRYE